MPPGTRSATQIGSLCMGMVSGRHALKWPAQAGGLEAWQRRLSRLQRACVTRHGGQRTRGAKILRQRPSPGHDAGTPTRRSSARGVPASADAGTPCR